MNMHEHTASKLSPFAQEGGTGHKGVKGAMNGMKTQKQIIGRVVQLFGAELPNVLEAMNRELAA